MGDTMTMGRAPHDGESMRSRYRPQVMMKARVRGPEALLRTQRGHRSP